MAPQAFGQTVSLETTATLAVKLEISSFFEMSRDLCKNLFVLGDPSFAIKLLCKDSNKTISVTAFVGQLQVLVGQA